MFNCQAAIVLLHLSLYMKITEENILFCKKKAGKVNSIYMTFIVNNI